MTEVDGLYAVVRTFGDEQVYARTEDRLGVELTLNQVIAIEIETVTSPLATVVDWVRANVRVRPGFRGARARAAARSSSRAASTSSSIRCWNARASSST